MNFPSQEDKEHALAVFVEAEKALIALRKQYGRPSRGYDDLTRIEGALRIVTDEMARFVSSERDLIHRVESLLSRLRYGYERRVRVEREVSTSALQDRQERVEVAGQDRGRSQ